MYKKLFLFIYHNASKPLKEVVNVLEISDEDLISRAGEMAQKLRVCPALTEGLSWVPGNAQRVVRLTAYDSRSRGSDTLTQALTQHGQVK